MSLENQVGGLKADAPRSGGGQVAHVHRIEVAPGGQHVQATATRRSAGTCRHEAATEGVEQAARFGGAAGVEAWGDGGVQMVKDRVHFRPVPPMLAPTEGGVQRLRDQFAGKQLQPLTGIPRRAPQFITDRHQLLRPWPAPRLSQSAIERIKPQSECLGQRSQQARLRPAPITTWDAQQRQQRIDAQTPGRRFTENVQAIADLRFLQVTQIRIQPRQPDRRVGVTVQAFVQLQLAVDMGLAHQLQDVTLQLPRPPWVEQLRFVILVGQQLQVAQRPVGFCSGQRWHQVINDHCLRAPLGLGALARIVDDERVDIGQRPEQRVRPAVFRQANALARQPFEIAVLANVNHTVRTVGVAQPEVERQVAMRWH
ncbi:hypothetical protein D3C73_758560 [compost metagenome]